MLTANRHDPGMSARGQRAPEVAVRRRIWQQEKKDVIQKSDKARSLRHYCGNLDLVNYNSHSDRIVQSHELSYHLGQRQCQLYMSSAIPGKIQVLSM